MSLSPESNTTSLYMTTAEMETSTEDFKETFTTAAVIVAACLLIPMMIFGILANSLTIIVIAKSQKLSSVFSLFIMSLCFSDLASALISPIFLYRRTWGFVNWNIPRFFCKFAWCIHMWTNYVTALHIVSFAAMRLCAIARPVQFKEIKNNFARIIIVVIWIVTFFTGGLPLAIWFDVRRNGILERSPSCSVIDESYLDMFRWYTWIAYPIFFYVPILAVTGLSVAILIKFLQRRNTKQDNSAAGTSSISVKTIQDAEVNQTKPKKMRNEHRAKQEKTAVLQLLLIVTSFFIGYLPFTIYQLISYQGSSPGETHDDRANDWVFGISEYICLRLSECLNPVFYNLASLTMWKETTTFLRKIFIRS